MKINILSFLLFLTIFSLIFFGLNYYVYSRVAGALGLSGAARSYLRIFFYVASLSFIAGEILTRRYPVYPVVYFGAVWLGIISIAFSVFILADIVGQAFRSPAIAGPIAHGQKQAIAVAALAIIVILSAFSVYNVLRGEIVREIKIPTAKLLRGAGDFTIVQLSDVHLNAITTKKWLDGIVDKTNSLNPDLIVITGDLIDTDICRFKGFCETLARLKAKYGVYATTGNHEFYVGINTFLEVCKRSNIKVLRNEKADIGGLVELAGIDWYEGWRFTRKVPYVESVLKECDFRKPVVLLSHQPDAFGAAAAAGADLQLSGHVHAGQIPPMDAICLFFFKYPVGLYRKAAATLYTTTGTGTWGPPMRLFSRNEIVKITLK
jgi:hypothetical protein